MRRVACCLPTRFDDSSYRPGARRKFECSLAYSETAPEGVVKPGPALVVQRPTDSARRPNPGQQRRPQVLEVCVPGAHHECAEAHGAESNLAPQLGKLALGAPPHDGSLIGRFRIDLAGTFPERTQEGHLAWVVPHARGDDPARPGHASHLAYTRFRVAHEVDHQLG